MSQDPERTAATAGAPSPGVHVPLGEGQPSSTPAGQPRRLRMRNVVVAVLALEVLVLCIWALLPERTNPNAYAFTTTQLDGKTPVAYDPCQPIHYVVRQKGAPPGGLRLITDAVARVEEVTGLDFVYDGPSDKSSADWAPVNALDSDRWAPVVISWDTPAENSELAGDVAGSGGSAARSLDDSPRVYVSGTVALDAKDMPKILAGPHGKREARSIILHELGHLVGLDHVNDKEQLMYPTHQRDADDFSAGDLTGLAALGKGPCVPELRQP